MSAPDWLADFLYRYRLALSAVVMLGAVVFAPYVNITGIDNDLSAWIAKDDPAYQDYERFRHEFGGTRPLIVAIQGNTIFTATGLRYIDRITHELEQLERVDRVQSLATANIVRPIAATPDDDGGIEVTPLLDNRLSSDEQAAAVRRDALEDPLMRGDLVSEDATVTAVVVTFDEDRIDEVRGQVLADIRAIVEQEKPTGLAVFYNGSLEISETYNRVTISNTTDLTPPIVAITLVALYWMFRSIRKTLLIAVAVGVSVIWTLGLYSAMGFSFNVLTSMLAPLVVVLAIADDVHIVQHFDQQLRATGSKEHAFKSSVRHLFAPLLGASGTTALGMLSLATSDVVAVRTFGIGAAIGVMVDFAHVVGLRANASDVRPAGYRAAASGALADGAASATWDDSRMVTQFLSWSWWCWSHSPRLPALPDSGSIPITSTSSRRTIRCRVQRRSSIDSCLASTASTSSSRGHRIRSTTPDILARWNGCQQEMSRAAFRQKGDVGRRLREARQSAVVGWIARRVSSAGHARRHRAGAVRIRSLRRGSTRAVPSRRQRLFASPHRRKARLDELRSGFRSDSPGGAVGSSGVRGHRGEADRHRIRPAFLDARPLSGRFAAE